MKIVGKILLGIVIVIVLVLLLGLFTKKEYTVERSIVINRPNQQVFDYIKFVKNHLNYNKWWRMDPNVKTTFTGTDGTPGFIAAWDSEMKEAGKGEQQITAVKEGEYTDCEIRFIKPFEGVAYTRMSTSAVTDAQTRVTWRFNGKMKYPMNIMLLFMNMDKMLGKDLEASLTSLKALLEK
ncbi:SRPBCC family protein [Filimonas effusa]|uniref:Polyketide cyclase n=1 Tax=Filimonas effusa TaxID=2508721 RepID=A0A4Q1CZP8_9BACT|nr:SRPBCC family protein [Filimonas effusa]RXK80887.1 polyketide cyclase [Filimonas effusa]